MPPLSRTVRITVVALALAAAAGTVRQAARSDAPANASPRGTERLDSWEGAIADSGGSVGTAGGVSDGDDWLG